VTDQPNPGDLPARMAAAIRSHTVDASRTDWWNEQHPYCVCGEQVSDWDDHAAKAAMEVRWEDHAATVAELGEALRKLERAISEHQVTQERLAEVRRDVEGLRAERDAFKAAVADVRRLQELTIAASCRVQAIHQAVDTLAVLDRALGTPETPGDAEERAR